MFLNFLPCYIFKRTYEKMVETYQIVMVRHGESEWNMKNQFCGWYDAPLSEKGVEEAKNAGTTLKDGGYKFDHAFTSRLSRAKNTLNYILEELDQKDIPITETWRLNERHYGGLTGLNKIETVAKFGLKQVTQWRRDFHIPPPPMEPDHPYYDAIFKDGRYAVDPDLNKNEFPKFESLKMTSDRTLPFWTSIITPKIKAGSRVIVAAHGNSLRGIIKHLDKISDKDIMALDVPTGIPFRYKLDANLDPIPNGSLLYLGDPETIKARIDAVKNQIKPK